MNNNLTFNQVFNEYIEYSNLSLKPTTILFIKRGFEAHILPFYQDKSIFEITENDFINWQNYLKGKGFGSSFNRHIQNMNSKFFNYMETKYSIKNLPKLYGNFKTFEIETSKIDVWTLREFKQFIKVVNDIVYKTLFELLFFTGLRKGEALALRFTDFDKKYIYINKTLTQEFIGGKRIELLPKSKKSIRKIRIDRKLRKNLIKLQNYYIKNFSDYNKNFFIFGGSKPLPTTTLNRRKNEYCKIAKVKQIRIHDFRHSHATILYHNKISLKLIQNRLGHADMSTTMNTYVHLYEKDEKRVIKTLNSLHNRF